MGLSKFIGREAELSRLKGLLHAKAASLIVVRGRRRIGKSRLLAEFGKDMRSLFFFGLPPARNRTAQWQRDEFSYQLERSGLPGVKPDDWGNLFWHLSKYTDEGRVLIVLDERSWMGGKNRLIFWVNLKPLYLKYIAPNQSKIEKGAFSNTIFTNLSGWDTIMGLQFENLITHNRKILWRLLGISLEELVMEGPFFQI